MMTRRMKMVRRRVVTACLVVGAALACDEPVKPLTTGSIAIALVFAPASAAGADGAVSGAPAAEAGSAGTFALDQARVTVAGPTPKVVTSSTPTGSNFELVVPGLSVGSYTVTVEGLTNNEVTYLGTQTGVSVTAGQTQTATVPFPPFVPTLSDLPASTSTILTLAPSWTAVAAATGYVIQVADNAGFTNQVEKTVTGSSVTTTTYNVTTPGPAYVRVRAVQGSMRSGPSAVKTITLTKEANDTSDAALQAVDLGFGAEASPITRSALNILPLGDVDWFTARICSADSLIVNARAVRLSPPSSLNTLLELHDSTGANALVSNDNADSTDAEIRFLSATSGRYRLRVSAAAGTAGSAAVGHYDAAFRFVAGARNTGTVCRSSVEVTPGTPTIGALGSTRQMTARLLDSDGNQINGATFAWTSSVQGVATVNPTTGLVTAVTNGSTNIGASTAGISGSVGLTVQQVVSLVPVTPGGATITTLGATEVLSAQAQDANGNPVPGKTITWGTLNPSIASVNPSSGTVTAVTSGQATITATSDGVTGYGVITVAPPTATAASDWGSDVSGTTSSLRAIWGPSDTDAFIVGNDGTILRYNGSTWSPMASGTVQALLGVWGSSSSNVIAVGGGGSILRYNGTAWSPMTSPLTSLLWGVWGAGPNAVFAVGNAGTILRYDGGSWIAMSSGTSDVIRGVWGSSATNVFAVGNGGLILRFNGTTWAPMANPAIEDLWGVWGFSATEVYAVGLAGTILRYNGTAWSAMTSGTSTNLRDVWGTSNNDLYAVGDGGTVLRYNGSNWAALGSGTTALLEGVWGTQAIHSVFGVGSNGTIAHGQRLGVVDYVDVTPPSANLNAIGATQQLAAQAFDASSSVLSGRTFTWISKNETVVTVNAAGLVTAVANGQAYVVGTTATKRDSALITVQQVIETVEVTPPAADVGIGSTAQLTAVAKDVNGQVVPGASFTWGTSDQNKATVDLSGLVTALEGTATITATSVNGKQGTATITASVIAVASVTVSPPSATIPVSGTQQLTATTRDASNNVLTGRAVTWESAQPSLAQVDEDGLVTAFGQGDAIITATSEGISGTATITVSGSVVSAVLVTPTPLTLTAIDATVQLSAEARDLGNNPVPDKPFSWISEDPQIATVDATGLVTAVGAGTVDIVATTDGISGAAAITIDQATETVEVVPPTGQVSLGNSSQLSIIARDVNNHVIVSPPAPTWSTLDFEVATVSPAGLVTGEGVGSTTITATISGHSGSSDVTVVPVPVATVEVTPAPTSVEEGLTVQLTAVTKDATDNVLTGRVVGWSSNSPNAEVDATGLVTGVTPGQATITATSEGQQGTSVVTITARSVQTVNVTPRGATVVVPGGNSQFTAEALDVSLAVIPGKVFTWASLNPAVATINPTSGVTAAVANGQVTISATVDGKTGYALLTVAPPATAVNLWDPENSGTSDDLRAIWGTSASDIFAVGGVGGGAPTIQRWNGTAWGAMTPAAGGELYGVWGSAGNNVIAVGRAGTLHKFDGSNWGTMTSPFGGGPPDLFDVWGSSPTVVYAVGAAGTIVRFNGAVWNVLTPVTAENLVAVWGSASNDIWAVGDNGTILHFTTGPSWDVATIGTSDYRAVWGTAANDVWVVATDGSIRHWNGSVWGDPVDGGAVLHTLWGASANDVYAAGGGGALLRYDGVNWTPAQSGTASDLFALWGRSGRVLAAGAGGVVQRGFRGASVLLSPANPAFATLETTQQLTAEARDPSNALIPGRTFSWGTTDNTIADVDGNGLVIAHGAGSAVITATTGGLSGTTNAIVAQVPASVIIAPDSPTLDAFGASVQLTATVRDAGSFVIPGATVTWESLDDLIATVTADGLVTAVGNGVVTITATSGAAVGNATVTVAQATASISVSPAGAQSTGASQVFSAEALDANGYPITGKNFTWSGLNNGVATVDVAGVATPVSSGQVSVKAEVDGKAGYGLLTVAIPVGSTINAWAVTGTGAGSVQSIWGPSATDLHAVSLGGGIYQYNGSWASATSPTVEDLKSVWGFAANDVFAAGGNSASAFIHYDASWTTFAGTPGYIYSGVWGASPQDVFAVGPSGTFVYYNGATWAPVHVFPTGYDLNAVWGTARNDVWAVGSGGTIVHFTGSGTTVENPVGENLNAVWGTSDTDIWAVGASGRILRYTGTWSPVTSPTGQDLTAVWGTSASEVYAVGANGTIIRYNGSDWVIAGAAPGVTLDGLFGFGSSAFVGASNGDILHGYRGATLAVTPPTQTLTTLGATQTLTAEVNGGAVTGVPVVWTSSDPYVATVNASTGEVTAVGRGTTTITATAAGGVTGTAEITVTAIRVARIQPDDSNQNSMDQAFASDLSGTPVTITGAALNALATPADIRAAYDVLLVPYSADDIANLNWTTRLLPFLNLGGGIVWEDMVYHLDNGELDAIAAGSWPGFNQCGAYPPCSITATVPGLTDGITAAFDYSGLGFSTWNSALTPFVGYGAGGPVSGGLYGKFGSGCIVLSGPLNDYFGSSAAAPGTNARNHYDLMLNALKWAADCPLTAEVGPPASVVITPDGANLNTYGQTRQFSAAAFDAVGNPIVSPTITWESSDEAILSIDQTGLVQAIAGNGTVNVTATVTGGSNPSDVVVVTINQPAATVTVTPDFATIPPGTQATFTATARNTNGDVLTNKVFNWNEGNSAVATMSSGTATAAGSGQTWVSASVDAKVAFGLVSVALSSATAVNVWSHHATPGAMYGMWGVNTSNQFAVGSGGKLWRNLGAGWAVMTGSGVVTTQPLYSVWGSGASNVFAVGGGGAILRFNGSAWSAMPQSGVITTQYLYRVWGSSPNNVYAVGDAGTIIRFDGTTWSAVSHPFGTGVNLWGVWGSSANDIYVSGYPGFIGHYDGSNWTTVPHEYAPGGTPFSNYFYSMWGTGPEDVWASGDFGTVLHCTGSGCASGTGWTPQTGTGGGYIVNLYGTGGDEVYALGSQGVFRYAGGGSFTQMTTVPAGTIWAVVGNEANSLWATGSSGRIFQGVRGAPEVSISDGVHTGTSIDWSGGFLLAEPMTVSTKTEITHLGVVMASPAAGVKMAIYRADGLVPGDPGTIVVQTVGSTVSGGIVEMPVTQTQITPGSYWIMAIFESGGPVECGNPATTLKYYSQPYASALGNFPTPVSTGSYCNSHFYAKGFSIP